MATTPHSSWNLSSAALAGALPKICFKGPLVCQLQRCDFPASQRNTSLTDFNAFLDCNAHDRTLDLVFFGDDRGALGARGRNEDARRRFVEQQDFRPKMAREVDLGPDFRRAERALRDRH